MLEEFQPNSSHKTAFILGNEVKGVQQSVIDEARRVIEIPKRAPSIPLMWPLRQA